MSLTCSPLLMLMLAAVETMGVSCVLLMEFGVVTGGLESDVVLCASGDNDKLHTKLQFRINGHKVTEEENFIPIIICAARFYSSQTNLV